MTKYTKKLLKPLVKESKSVSEILRKLGKCKSGGTHKLISDKIKEYGLDNSHFSVTSNHYFTKKKLSADEILINNKRPRHELLKRALIEIGRPYECEKCKQGSEWNGEKLTLQIDHINADTYDQREDNLRFLCPNCHSQTKNWGYKNRGVKSKKDYGICPICKTGKLKSKNSKYCSSKCRSISQRKVEWPSKEELQKLMKNNSYVKIGKKYGVSDGSVKRWVKSYNLI